MDAGAADEERLGDGLVLRAVRDERDVERYAALNRAVTGAAQGVTSAHLLRHHPETGYGDYLLVEDEATGEVVSTTCLLPWRCSYEGIELNVAQLEMVVTHPAYRRRGLVRAQVRRFHRLAAERGCDLCLIEGIPYYYRQFGYAYAVDHWASDSLPTWRIPRREPARHRLRPATVADASLLEALYHEAMAGLDIHLRRSAAYWRYLLEWARWPVRVLEAESDGRPAGYVVTSRLEGGRGTRAAESAVAGAEAGLDALRLLAAEGGSELQLGWPQESTLVRLGRSLGGTPLPHYQWLVRIVSVPGLLARIAPVLERRLSASPLAGLTEEVCLNLFREAFLLRFREGRLAAVEPAGFVDASMGAQGGDINLPPEAFLRLLLGYRRLDELWDAWPDAVIRPEKRLLVEVLFPKLTSYLCAPYMVHEPSS